MAMNINVGLAKKLGLPEYGSLGAGCNVEFEAEQNLLQGDPEGFHQRVRRVYAACAQADSDELARQQGTARNRHRFMCGIGTGGTPDVKRPPKVAQPVCRVVRRI